MTDKELLNIDLCARLPYIDTMVRWKDEDYHMIDIGFGRVTLVKPFMSITAGSPLITEVKPYLRPLEDMTEVEKEELRDLCWFGIPSDDYDEYDHKGVEVVSYIWNKRNDFSFDFDDFNALLDWLNKKYFDYRGLIPKNLAIKVTEENDPYNNK